MTTITAPTQPVRTSVPPVVLAIAAATLMALLVAWLVVRGGTDDTRAPAADAAPAPAAAYDPFADAFNTELRAVPQYDAFADAFNTELRAVPQYDAFADEFNTELRAVTAR